MGKQRSDRARKILSILILVFLAISVTAVTGSADYYSKVKCDNGYWECKYPYYDYNYDQYGNYCQGHWLCPSRYNIGDIGDISNIGIPGGGGSGGY